ncbi:MAG: hypothetical protein P8Z78_03755 [Gammaproteobacteria bacterium]|jgi:hypothetical protein
MNLFGAFGFGSLIKTFLPGLLFFFAFLGYIEIFLYLVHGYTGLYAYLFSKPVLLTAIAIPASVILGATLNSIVFSGFSEWILEKRHKAECSDFYDFRRRMFSKVTQTAADQFTLGDEDRNAFMTHVDPRYFLLHRRSLENIMYLRESYWYYMEFQLNTLMALWIGLPAILVALVIVMRESLLGLQAGIASMALILLVYTGFSRLFLTSARDNLDAHRKKELSLLIGTACFELYNDKPAGKS